MAGNSEKKISKARNKSKAFYLPIFLLCEFFHITFCFIKPSIKDGLLANWSNYTIAASLCMSSVIAWSLVAIIAAAAIGVSGSDTADKWNRSGTPTEKKKKQREIAASTSIDVFFLVNAIKVGCIFFDFFWMIGVVFTPIFYCFKIWAMVNNVKGILSGGKNVVGTPDADCRYAEEEEPRGKRDKKKKNR